VAQPQAKELTQSGKGSKGAEKNNKAMFSRKPLLTLTIERGFCRLGVFSRIKAEKIRVNPSNPCLSAFYSATNQTATFLGTFASNINAHSASFAE